ncbi:MAG: hypothetical protein ACLRQY_06600 [[Clostridium] leptum]|jgi:hypothetical protein
MAVMAAVRAIEKRREDQFRQMRADETGRKNKEENRKCEGDDWTGQQKRLCKGEIRCFERVLRF